MACFSVDMNYDGTILAVKITDNQGLAYTSAYTVDISLPLWEEIPLTWDLPAPPVPVSPRRIF